mmetsp:Transcript_31086/g.93179  ORF Transcript_31086/g.93179 Transcript_31086/m.93179 type:complete len:517 (-) Transcript_31086:46-1596(-)
MSGTLLESARSTMEELEALELLAVESLAKKPSGSKAAMERDAVVANVVDGMAGRATTLTTLYADADGSYRSEVQSMRGPGVFTTFYGALKETREYYARHGATAAKGAAQATAQAAVERARRVETVFSGEEMWGKYLDLGALHREFCNLPSAPGGADLEYVAYLRMLGAKPFAQILPEKLSGAYARHAAAVDAYLSDFWKRTQPLVPLEPLLDDASKAFEAKWAAEQSAAPAGNALDLSKFGAEEELRALGLDRLKRALVALGLKCGGDVNARARRLWSVRGVAPGDIDPKLKAKASKKRPRDDAAGAAAAAAPAADDRKKRTARSEARIEALLGHLQPTLDATLRRAERKLTRTKDEIDAEAEDEEFGVAAAEAVEEEEEENEMEDPLDAPLYNPKNLPLGWDGRPIPYWLYKLHGLDQAFVCEICGNQTYHGRRAFDQHFNEWRHSHGMRCLRIPNTKHFHGVTKMDDAVALWEQLQEKQELEQFKAERDEEYEDSDGNVLNRATYEDLARQGLL